jgi:hypothetical protein
MNLPRHTLSSHALSPTFVNAQFTTLREFKEGTSSSNASKNKIRSDNNAEGRDRGGGERKGKQTYDEKGVEHDDIIAQDASSSMFACATREGYFIARTHPLGIVKRRGKNGGD